MTKGLSPLIYPLTITLFVYKVYPSYVRANYILCRDSSSRGYVKLATAEPKGFKAALEF